MLIFFLSSLSRFFLFYSLSFVTGKMRHLFLVYFGFSLFSPSIPPPPPLIIQHLTSFLTSSHVISAQAVHRAQHESAARAAVLLPFSSRRLAESNVVDHTDTNEALQLVQPDQLGEQQQGMAPVAPAAKHMPLAPRGPRLGGPLAMAQGLHIHTGVGNGLRAQARPLAMPNAEAAMRGALSTERLDQQEAVGKRALQAMPKTRDHPEVNDQKGPPPPHQDHSQLDGQKGPPPPPPPHSGSEAHGSGGHGGGGDGGSGSGNPHGPPPPPPAAPDQGVAATSNSDTTSEEAEAVRAAAVALADALKAYQAAHGESLVAELVAPGGALAALVTEFSDGSSTSIASASGLFLHEDWSNAVAADQSACAADFKSLCGGQEEEEAGSMPPHHDGEAPHWFRRALLQDDHHGHGHDDKHDKPHDDHHHDDMHEKSHDDHHHGPDGHHGPDDHSKQDGSHDGSQDARHGPLGFGSREADQCLRTHLTSTSPPCRAAVARTDSIYLYLSQSGDAPRPPPHHPPSHDDLDDDEVNGAHGEGHPPPPHARWTNGLLVLALLVSCVLARRRRLSVRQARAKVAQALQTLDSHPALKLALEDAAGVTLPSPQWKFKVHAVLAANPRLQQALLEAEADDHSALSGGANHHRHPDGEHLQLVDVNEHGQQLDSATVRHHHGAGGDVGGPPHFDPFHGGPITHPRQRACGRRGAPCVKRAVAIVLLLVLVAMAFHASMHGPGGGGDEGVWDTSSEEGGGSSGSDDVHNDAPNDPPSENEGTDDERPPPPTSLGSLGLVLGAAFLAVCVLRTCRRFRCTQEPNHNELAVAVPTEDAEQGEVVVLSKEDAKAAAAGYPSGSSSSSKNGAVPVLPSNSVVVISAQVVSK